MSAEKFLITGSIDMKNILKITLTMVMSMFLASCSGADGGGDNPSGGQEPTPPESLSSGYLQRMVAMQFTSVGCVNCPFLSAAIKDIQKEYPGKVIPVAFHMDYGNEKDPMALTMNDKFYKKISHSGNSLSLPMFSFNFRKSSQPIVNEYSKIVSEMEMEESEYPAACGVAVESSYDEDSRTVVVKARFKSDVAKDYRYHIFILEDGIQYAQMGSENGEYVHDNVLRYIFADHIGGAKLEKGAVLEPGKEYVVEKSLKLDGDWNSANVRIVAAMLCSEDGGYNYFSNNANVCDLGESTDYLYEE